MVHRTELGVQLNGNGCPRTILGKAADLLHPLPLLTHQCHMKYWNGSAEAGEVCPQSQALQMVRVAPEIPRTRSWPNLPELVWILRLHPPQWNRSPLETHLTIHRDRIGQNTKMTRSFG